MSGTRYVFILGAPNDVDGRLSLTSLARIDTAERLYRDDPKIRVVVTGGYGAHFNRAQRPHRVYVGDELGRRGIVIEEVPDDLMASANTVQDALSIESFVEAKGLSAFEVITSAFHVARCHFIFDCVFTSARVALHSAADPADLMPSVVEHEARALADLVAQGGVMVGTHLLRHSAIIRR